MISIIVPIYNEQSNLKELHDRILQSSNAWNDTFEAIFVDDGSVDRSPQIIKEFHEKDARFKVVSFARNFGHQVAVSAGLRYVKGNVVVVMDADLQDPPEIIEKFISKWREGYQVVYAVRRHRKEFFLKRATYWLFYRILAWAAEIKIPLDSGDFCVMDRKVVDVINEMPERNRFVRGLRSWTGFRQVGMEYDRNVRYSGKPKYSIAKLFKLALDGIISFSYKPLQVFGFFGFWVALISLAGLILFIFAKVFDWNLTPFGLGKIPGVFAIMCVVLFMGGVQLIGIGLFGEYLARVYDEVKRRPHFVIKETLL